MAFGWGRKTGLVIAVLAGCVVGCTKIDESLLGIDPNDLPPDFIVAVAPGTTPSFSWPGAAVLTFTLARKSRPADRLWVITSFPADSNRVASGLVYGVLQPGTGQTVPQGGSAAPELLSGTRYTVVATRSDGTRGLGGFTQ